MAPPVRSVAWRLKVEGDEIAVQKLTGVGSAARKAIEPVPGLLRGVSAASQEFQSGLTSLGGRIGIVGTALTAMGPIGTAAAGMLGILALAAHEAFSRTRDANQFADSVEKAAHNLRLGTGAYQEISAAAKEFNIDQGEVNGGFGQLRDTVAQFIAGVGGARITPVFKQLGLSREALADAGSFERQINLIANALARVKNSDVREGLASRLGLNTLLPLLQNGSGALDKLRADARTTGQVLDESLVKTGADGNREYEKLSTQVETRLRSAFIGFTPILNTWRGFWADLAGKAADFVQSLQGVENQSGEYMRRRTEELKSTISDLKKQYEAYGGSGSEIGNEDAAVIRAKLLAAQREAAAIRGEFWRRGEGLPIGVGNPKGDMSGKTLADLLGANVRTKLPPTQEEINAARAAEEKAAREQAQRAEKALTDQEQLYEQRVRFMEQLGVAELRSSQERVQAENAANVEMLRGKAGYYQALLKQANDAANAEIAVIQAEVSQQFAALERQKDAYEAVGLAMPGFDDARSRIEAAGRDQVAAVNARRLQDQVSIAREARGAIGQLVDEMNGPLDLAAKNVGAGALQTFTDTLVGIGTGARDAGEAVGDMVTSILADLERLVVQRSITAPLGDALNGLLDGIFAGPHADGGSVRAGLFSRINERGGFPEAMMSPDGDISILSSPTSLQTVVDAVRRSGSLASPVIAAPSAPPVVEIHNHGEPLAVERQRYDSASNTLKLDLKREVLNSTRDDIRNGGVDAALSDRFSVRPARKRRQ